MKESYGEGVASHTGPESCGDARKGVDEALAGVRAGGAIEPRNENPPQGGHSEVPTQIGPCGRRHRQHRYREMLGDLTRSKNLGMHGNISCGNRESQSSPERAKRTGRIGKSEDVRR